MNFHESKKQINKLDEIDLILQLEFGKIETNFLWESEQDIFKQNVFAN